jgi:hypothetical protein
MGGSGAGIKLSSLRGHNRRHCGRYFAVFFAGPL